MEIQKTDILVVGAGPTGLVLSNFLGVYGINCILVERNASTTTEPRAVSIDDESLRTLQAIGVVDYFLPLISKNYGSHYLSPSGKTFAIIEPSETHYGFHKRNGFDQPQLESLLYKNLSNFDNITIYFNATLSKISVEKQYIRSFVSCKNKSINIESQYVVACDGGSSTIRKQLGIRFSGLSFNERWLIIDLFDSKNKFRHTQAHCDSRRPCITLPGPRGIRRYEFKLRKGECKDDHCDENFATKLLREKGYESQSRIRRKCVYTFNAMVAERWSFNNIFLAGDSAHLSPPFAGQGMNSGIRDAHNLAWKLMYAITYNNRNILNSYQIERKDHAWQMIKISILMGKILSPKNVLNGLLIRWLFWLLSIYPPVREYVSQMKFKPQPYFSKGLVWRTHNTLNNKMIGRLFPQPLVEDLNGNQFLIDRLFNNESVIVIFSENPENLIETKVLEKFNKRGVPIIGITPEWINPVLTDFTIVREVTKILSSKKFIGYLDKAFFVRPDRYVASISNSDSIEYFMCIVNQFQNKA